MQETAVLKHLVSRSQVDPVSVRYPSHHRLYLEVALRAMLHRSSAQAQTETTEQRRMLHRAVEHWRIVEEVQRCLRRKPMQALLIQVHRYAIDLFKYIVCTGK
ncbi:hypothetical protein D3C80_1298320 [compost metagenome]